MSPRVIAGVATGAVLIGGLAWQYRQAPAQREPAEALPASRSVAPQPPTPLAKPLGTDETRPEVGTEAFNKLAKERGLAWMADRNRDAVSLLAMWDMTGDEDILREAAEKYPGDPQVCLAMMGVAFATGGNEEDQRKWTEHLVVADPENPLGFYYRARLAQNAGDRAGVIAALETALVKKDRIDYYLRERMTGAKEGLLASGIPLKDAYFLSMAVPMTKSSELIFGTGKLMEFFKQELANMKASGNENELQELAALGLRLSEHQRQTESPLLVTELMAHSQRIKFLSELDPETEIANTGRSVAEELTLATAEKEKLSKLMRDVTSAQQYLLNAPLEVQGQYADRMMMDGEMAAIRFLFQVRASQ